MAILTWRDVEQKYEEVSGQVDSFFHKLEKGELPENAEIQVSYRDGQKNFSTAVMKAIKEKKILLVEAGVGIGKSFGYLIPLFYTINGIPKFKKVIISTSSIALGEQLIKDVNKVCSLLGIELQAEISKGINNYACLKKIYMAIDSSKDINDEKALRVLENIKKQMISRELCDKNDLQGIPNSLWKRISVSGGCNNCDYMPICPFQKKQKSFGQSDIIITNHTQLANMLKNKTELVKETDAIIIDEAHKLEEEIRLSFEETLNISEIISKLDQIKEILRDSDKYYASDLLEKLNNHIGKIISAIINFIKALRTNANMIYRRTNQGLADIKTAPKLSIGLESSIVRDSMAYLLKTIQSFNNIFNQDYPIPGLKKNVDYIKRCISILEDMAKGTDSKNIYWVKYINDKDITIVFTKKELSRELELLFEKDRPVIMTSGTLATQKNYDKITNSLELNFRDDLETITPIPSPFDYENNSLFYYDTSITNPKDKNHTAYITDLAIRIKELIEITNGKALILFTSKSDMQAVYKIVSNMGLKQKLILQGEDAVSAKVEFERNINSCLFATGVFWEGIDFKGKTLSNLIIARLPFPVEDPIVEYKVTNLGKKEQFKLIEDEMLMKLAQGTGRLIRSVTDTGIVCSLDSRTPLYLNEIINTLPFKKYTDDLNDVVNFANKKVIEQDEKRLTLNC